MGTFLDHPPVRWVAGALTAAVVATAVAALGLGSAGATETEPVAAGRRAEPAPATTTTLPPTTTTTVPPTTTTVPPTTTTTAPPLPVFDPADSAPGWEQRRGEAALARINFDPAAIGYTIQYLPARPGYFGMTYPKEHRIDVWVRPDESLELLAHVTAHELGHAVDLTWNDDGRRGHYLHLRGISPRSWFTCNGCTDFSTPAGDYAETFAYWVLGGTDFRSQLAPPPSPEQLAQLAPLFGP